MPHSETYYLTQDLNEQIAGLIEQYTEGAIELTPEQLLEKLLEILPIEKMNQQTILRRVEGYSQATDLLLEKALAVGHLDRQQIVAQAKLKPMSYYHYLTGSRESADYAKTREDLLNDPTTALAKLHDDIIGLAGLIPKLKEDASNN